MKNTPQSPPRRLPAGDPGTRPAPTLRRERFAPGHEFHFLLLAAAVLLLLSLAACRESGVGEEEQAPDVGVAAGTVEHGEEAVDYYDAELQVDTGAGGPGPLAAGSSVVEVLLRDDSIELPESLPQGKVTFVVTNTGAREHSLAITGEGGEYELEVPLAPGESGEIELVLDPGLYRVYSPDEDRRLEGMVKRLRVTP
jgi:uncharacterized cupredoxin-like copper-binding protein